MNIYTCHCNYSLPGANYTEENRDLSFMVSTKSMDDLIEKITAKYKELYETKDYRIETPLQVSYRPDADSSWHDRKCTLHFECNYIFGPVVNYYIYCRRITL